MTNFLLAIFMFAICHSAFALKVVTSKVMNSGELKELKQPAYILDKDKVPFKLPLIPKANKKESSKLSQYWVNQVSFTGNTEISSEELLSLCTNYLGRNISIADLELLRQELTRYYIDQGYLNSGVLFAKPTIIAGTLNFLVVEGQLNNITIKGLEGLNSKYISEKLVQQKNSVLNVNELRERFQLLLDDPLFERLNARILPGKKAGEAVMDIEVDRATPYQISLLADNVRSPSIGSKSYGIHASLRNLIGRGDYLSGQFKRTSSMKADDSYHLFWSIPLTFQGTEISLSAGQSDSSLIDEQMAVLDIKNTLKSYQAGLSHQFINQLNHQFKLGIDYQYRENETSLQNLPYSDIINAASNSSSPTEPIKINDLRFWQEYTYRTERQVMAVRTTIVGAKSNLKSEPEVPVQSNYTKPDTFFAVLQGQYASLIPNTDVQFRFKFNGQYAKESLMSFDKLAIGGMRSVRGYRENQIIRDKGFFINAELEYTALNSSLGKLSFIPFLDYGEGQDIDSTKDSLASLGLALNYQLKGLKLNLAWAKPLKYKDEIKLQSGDLQDEGIHFQVQYDFVE